MLPNLAAIVECTTAAGVSVRNLGPAYVIRRLPRGIVVLNPSTSIGHDITRDWTIHGGRRIGRCCLGSVNQRDPSITTFSAEYNPANGIGRLQ